MTEKLSKNKAAKRTAIKTKKAAKQPKAIAPINYCNFAKLLTETPFTTTMETNMAKNTKQFETFTKDATEASREYFEAVTKSCSIFTKGYEGLLRTSMELSQTAAEKQAAYAKEALSCKTINEFTEIQNKATQSNFDDFMSGVTKLSEISTKVMTDSIEPLNEQVNKAVQAVNKTAA